MGQALPVKPLTSRARHYREALLGLGWHLWESLCRAWLGTTGRPSWAWAGIFGKAPTEHGSALPGGPLGLGLASLGRPLPSMARHYREALSGLGWHRWGTLCRAWFGTTGRPSRAWAGIAGEGSAEHGSALRRQRKTPPKRGFRDQLSWPWQCLYFLPLPQGHGSLRPTLGSLAWLTTSAASSSAL